jgi:hypothetical protein
MVFIGRAFVGWGGFAPRGGILRPRGSNVPRFQQNNVKLIMEGGGGESGTLHIYTGHNIPDIQSLSVLLNRNRRTCNFLSCGTGTVTCQKAGTGTRYKTSFLLHFFHSHFTVNLLKFMNFFLVKPAYYVKRQKFCQNLV